MKDFNVTRLHVPSYLNMKRWFAEWEVTSSTLGWTNAQGLKKTEENVLPLYSQL